MEDLKCAVQQRNLMDQDALIQGGQLRTTVAATAPSLSSSGYSTGFVLQKLYQIFPMMTQE